MYSLDNAKIAGLEPETVVPSLVVKIARRHRVAWTAREAWFYEEMECLQGSVVPYCYGWFELELGDALDSSAPSQYSIPALDNYPVVVSAKDDLGHFEGRAMHPLLAERRERRDIVSVLILERLGGMLPLGKPISEETRCESKLSFDLRASH